jgi:hypothetical protein
MQIAKPIAYLPSSVSLIGGFMAGLRKGSPFVEVIAQPPHGIA